MTIEISQLPLEIQEEILTISEGKAVKFTNNGLIIGTLKAEPKDSLIATAGILKKYNIDGLEYERQIRSEWDREWD